MAEKIHGRLQTPKDENGKRKDIFLMTGAEDVVVKDDESGELLMLDEKLQQVVPQVTDTKPNFACLWARPAQHLSDN